MAEQPLLPDPLDPKVAVALETARLNLLTQGETPHEILIVSDLHLGRGREPYTRRFICTENFVSDQAFERWLRASHPEDKKLLVLNGDTFDFIRVANCPETPQEFAQWQALLARLGVTKTVDQLQAAICKKEERYGLQTDDYKCVWKLLQMAEGHQEFFRALAYWIEHGGSLLMVKGNHDLDLYWPLVRKAMLLFLQDEGASAPAIQRVFYCDSSLTIHNVYLEHGHRYDPQQDMSAGPTLPKEPTQLNLPLATFIARYLINQLEQLEPFLGCLVPSERVMWIVLRRYPVAGIGMLTRSLTFLRRALQLTSKKGTLWYVVFFASVGAPLGVLFLFIVLVCFRGARDWMFRSHPNISFAVGVLSVMAPYLVSAFREITRRVAKWLARRRREVQIGEDDLAKGVYENVRHMTFPKASKIYAVMGHTHDQDVQTLPDIRGSKVLYLNTGAWIPVWPEDRPDLAGQVLFPFVRFRKGSTGEYHHTYCEWRDDRGEPAEPYILAPSVAR
jgi:UDP-2,3-diacylglucosamine pyrophosphatase LpxH